MGYYKGLVRWKDWGVLMFVICVDFLWLGLKCDIEYL